MSSPTSANPPTRARGDVGEQHLGGVGLAEHHVGAPLVVIGLRRTDHEVGAAVAIDVARGPQRRACAVVGRLAADHIATCAAGHRREVDRRAIGLAEHDIHFTREVGGVWRPDCEVRPAVAIEVAERSEQQRVEYAGIRVRDHEAALASRDPGQRDLARQRAAEHHVPTIGPDATRRLAVLEALRIDREAVPARGDGDVREPVTVDVADTLDHLAGELVRCLADEGQPLRLAEHELRLLRRTEHHERTPGLVRVVRGRPTRRADDDIRQTVTVDVARARDGVAGPGFRLAGGDRLLERRLAADRRAVSVSTRLRVAGIGVHHA